MKILLDECLPLRLKDRIVCHECQTVPEALLGGKQNGELLAIAESRGFQVFLTMDKGARISAKSCWPSNRGHCFPRPIESSRGPLAINGFMPYRSAFDRARPDYPNRRIAAGNKKPPASTKVVTEG